MPLPRKSVVIATTPSIAKQVVATFARHDVHVQVADQAKDLGLDVPLARRPMRRTMAKAETNEKMREIRQMDIEAGECTFVETGSVAAESLWNGGSGCAADVDQAGEDESG